LENSDPIRKCDYASKQAATVCPISKGMNALKIVSVKGIESTRECGFNNLRRSRTVISPLFSISGGSAKQLQPIR